MITNISNEAFSSKETDAHSDIIAVNDFVSQQQATYSQAVERVHSVLLPQDRIQAASEILDLHDQSAGDDNQKTVSDQAFDKLDAFQNLDGVTDKSQSEFQHDAKRHKSSWKKRIRDFEPWLTNAMPWQFSTPFGKFGPDGTASAVTDSTGIALAVGDHSYAESKTLGLAIAMGANSRAEASVLGRAWALGYRCVALALEAGAHAFSAGTEIMSEVVALPRIHLFNPLPKEDERADAVHLFKRTDETISSILKELALEERYRYIGWFTASHGKPREPKINENNGRRKLIYLCTSTHDADQPLLCGVHFFDQGKNMDLHGVSTVTDLDMYKAFRIADRPVIFRPSPLVEMKPRALEKSGLLIVDTSELHSTLVDRLIDTLSINVTHVSIRVRPDQGFLGRYQQALRFKDDLEAAAVVVTNDAVVAVAGLFLKCVVIVITEDLTTFSKTGFSNLMIFLSPTFQHQLPLKNMINDAINSKRKSSVETICSISTLKPVSAQLTNTGTAIVTACMDRNAHLLAVLPSWLATSVAQIVIIDWGSRKPVDETLFEYKLDPRITIVRVENTKEWVLSFAYNLAVRVCFWEYILKLDCDSELLPNFIETHSFRTHEASFYSGNWRTARDENELHTNGVAYFRKSDFLVVNGYNEFIITYGFDDSDFYERMQKFLVRMDFQTGSIRHLQHTDTERISNQPSVNDSVDVEIERNRIISERFVWGLIHVQSMYSITPAGSRRFICQRLQSETLTPEQRDIALQDARVNKQSRKRRLYARVKMGIGNRLRALASLFVIARNTGCELVIIWLPDNHCAASFSEIFLSGSGELVGTFVFNSDVVVPKDTRIIVIGDNTCTAESNLIPNQAGNGELLDFLLATRTEDLDVSSSEIIFSKNRNWNEEDVFLRNLPLAVDIEQIITNITVDWDVGSMIGIHIRSGQNPQFYDYEDTSTYSAESQTEILKWRAAANVDSFSAEIQKVLYVNPAQVFFVASDNADVIDILLVRFSSTTIKYHARTVFDRSVEQIKAAAVDLFILGKMKALWESNWSSFSEVAYRIAGVKARIAGIDF